MRRRTFLAALGSVIAATRSTIAQPVQGLAHVGILLGSSADDPLASSLSSAALDGLRSRGWILGQNLSVVTRYNQGRPELSEQFAAEFVSAQMDLVIAAAPPNAIAISTQTSTIPIVFFAIGDPIGDGLVHSLSRPGTNATGFTKEGGLGGKFLELLHTVFPAMAKAALLYSPEVVTPGEPIEATFLEGITALGIDGIILRVRTVDEARVALQEFSATPGAGVVLASDNFTFSNRSALLGLLREFALPAIHAEYESVIDGGLIAYSVDRVAIATSAGRLAGTILNGAKPEEIPVQGANRFVLAVNLSAASRLGLTVPTTLLAIADIVIE